MRKLVTLTLAAAMLCATGCAKPVTKMWEAAGGSRSDATVTVGYTYQPQREIPQANAEQARREAVERCRAWGYSEAEAFGLVSQRCVNMYYGAFGPQCLEMLVTQQYQCLGRGDAATPSESAPKSGYSGTSANYSSDPNFVGPMIPGNPRK